MCAEVRIGLVEWLTSWRIEGRLYVCVCLCACMCAVIPGRLANGLLSLPVTSDSFRFPPTVMMGL